MLSIEGACVVTASGQTVLPKSVRHRLQITDGGVIAFRTQEQTVTLHTLTEDDVHSLSLMPFLALLSADVTSQGDLLPAFFDPPSSIIDACAERIDPLRPIRGKVTL